jgi:hypothetical protein
MNHSACCYRTIPAEDDAQLIGKRMPAHMSCAFGEDGAGWTVVDARDAANANAPQRSTARRSSHHMPGHGLKVRFTYE